MADVRIYRIDNLGAALSRLYFSLTILIVLLLTACSDKPANLRDPSKTHDAFAKVEQTTPQIALAGRVTDAAKLLTPAQSEIISTKLANFENLTKHQMVVVTVPSLSGQSIDQYTRTLANAWRVGRGGHDDGIVLLVAPQEAKIRIAVGYGLEEELPNALCSEIIQKSIVPYFRSDDFFGGIDAGTDAIIGILS